ncbi:MAG: type II RES/Xre toxin-antitoxin system antitoxin [Terriglobales bacterium]
MTVVAIAEVLGVARTARQRLHSAADLATVTRAGLSVAVLDKVAGELSVPRAEVARLLGISPRTLSRRATRDLRLSATESDRLVRLAGVVALAKSTLGTMDRASRWLQAPNRALQGDRPLDRLDTDAGVRSVEQVLRRIEFGLYS